MTEIDQPQKCYFAKQRGITYCDAIRYPLPDLKVDQRKRCCFDEANKVDVITAMLATGDFYIRNFEGYRYADDDEMNPCIAGILESLIDRGIDTSYQQLWSEWRMTLNDIRNLLDK